MSGLRDAIEAGPLADRPRRCARALRPSYERAAPA